MAECGFPIEMLWNALQSRPAKPAAVLRNFGRERFKSFTINAARQFVNGQSTVRQRTVVQIVNSERREWPIEAFNWWCSIGSVQWTEFDRHRSIHTAQSTLLNRRCSIHTALSTLLHRHCSIDTTQSTTLNQTGRFLGLSAMPLRFL